MTAKEILWINVALPILSKGGVALQPNYKKLKKCFKKKKKNHNLQSLYSR